MISLTGSTLNSQKDTNNTHTDNNPIDENNAKFFYIIKSCFKGTNKERKMKVVAINITIEEMLKVETRSTPSNWHLNKADTSQRRTLIGNPCQTI